MGKKAEAKRDSKPTLKKKTKVKRVTSGDNGQAKRNENYQKEWLRIFMILLEYKAKYGHVDVPARARYKGVHLGNWTVRQRVIKDKLTKEQRSLLKKAGFNFDPLGAIWEERYKMLLKFYEKNGHTNVPMDFKKFPKLAKWVHMQRKYYVNGTLEEEKIKRLNHMHFVWDARELLWNNTLEKLENYYQKHGDFFPGFADKETKALCLWKNEQIRHYKEGKLKPHRFEKLKAIGFDVSDKLYSGYKVINGKDGKFIRIYED